MGFRALFIRNQSPRRTQCDAAIFTIPTEAWLIILKFLPLKDVLQLRLVCIFFNNLWENNKKYFISQTFRLPYANLNLYTKEIFNRHLSLYLQLERERAFYKDPFIIEQIKKNHYFTANIETLLIKLSLHSLSIYQLRETIESLNTALATLAFLNWQAKPNPQDETCFFIGLSRLTDEFLSAHDTNTILKVSFQNCALTHLPQSLPFRELKLLDLSNNRFSRFPSGILQLTELESLDLSHNPLTAVPPKLHRLQRLNTLSVSACTELRRIPTGRGVLKRLRNLRVENTQLEDLPSRAEVSSPVAREFSHAGYQLTQRRLSFR